MFFHMKTEGHWNRKDGNLGTLLVSGDYYCNDYFYFSVHGDWASNFIFSLILNKRT